MHLVQFQLIPTLSKAESGHFYSLYTVPFSISSWASEWPEGCLNLHHSLKARENWSAKVTDISPHNSLASQKISQT